MHIVPIPKKVELRGNFFSLERQLVCDVGEFDKNLVQILSKDIKIKNILIEGDKPNIRFIHSKLKNEEYHLEINENEICIKASTNQGIFYGIKTLKQIVSKKQVKCCKIEDSPDLSIRGAMIDISRSKVPTLKTLKQMVELLCDLKYNHMELYVEGFSYEYQNFKEVLDDNNYIKLEEYIELEKYANERYIDLVPNQNGFGHMADWLARKEYKKLAECENGFTIWGCHRPPSTLDPTNKGSHKLVKRMYEDMLPHFKSKYFNMNFDEPYELGYGKSKEKCDASSKEDVYIEYLNPLYKLVKKYQKIPMIWGDVIIHNKDAINKLPKDLIVIDWGYHLNYNFDAHAELLNENKRKYMMAPGTCTWSTITGRYDDMIATIKNSTTALKKNNGLGMLLTDWGDIGHLQYLPFSYPGFIYGAQSSWSEPNEEVIEIYLNKLVGNEISKAIIELSKYTRLEGPYRDYGSRLFSLILWSEHSMRQVDQMEFFLSKIKSNLIDDDNLDKLEKLFKEYLNCIRPVESIEKAEVENSINLLLTLVDIQRNLKKVINENQKDIFDKDILILEAYLGKHLELWKLRNVEAGYIPSGNRIKWLIKILKEIDGRR